MEEDDDIVEDKDVALHHILGNKAKNKISMCFVLMLSASRKVKNLGDN